MNNIIKAAPLKLDTRERILETAERLFAERGFEATTLRHITRQAGVNLAAVNYHFGSKEGLVKELLNKRIVPMNANRRALLEKYRFESPHGVAPLERIYEAFLRPFFNVGAPGGDSDGLFLRMLGRISSEKPGFMVEVYQEHFKDIQELFVEAIGEAQPELEKEELYWKFHFALSLMLTSMTQRQRLKFSSNGYCDPGDIESLIERLIDFICAGFRSAVPAKGNFEIAEVQS